MYKESDIARLEFILNLIDDLDFIIKRHGSRRSAIEDREGKHAVLMCLQQIGESLGKLEDESLKKELEGREANIMRNIIAHDYMGVKLSIVQKTLEDSIPRLKNKIKEIV